MVSRSAAYLRAYERLCRFARDATAPILLEGESGTGKTQLARRAHELSPRSRGPFHQVNLAAMDDGLANSELFGHLAGAFTDARRPRAGLFASSSGGTLCLDEIGKASRLVQQKLLHAVEYGEVRPLGSDRSVSVDVRIIAVANVSLEWLVAEEAFLPDLFARLEAFRVVLPPLRHRRADIPLLVTGYVEKHAKACGTPTPAIDEDLMRALQAAPWPKNLRQLSAVVHRLIVDSQGASALTLDLCRDDLAFLRAPERLEDATLAEAKTREMVDEVGNISEAARRLGVHRSTVHRRLGRKPE